MDTTLHHVNLLKTLYTSGSQPLLLGGRLKLKKGLYRPLNHPIWLLYTLFIDALRSWDFVTLWNNLHDQKVLSELLQSSSDLLDLMEIPDSHFLEELERELPRSRARIVHKEIWRKPRLTDTSQLFYIKLTKEFNGECFCYDFFPIHNKPWINHGNLSMRLP